MELQWIWAAPPGWPTPPGWVPPAGWHAEASWPPAPPNWVFWRCRDRPWDLFDLDADTVDHTTIPQEPGPARWVAPLGWPNLDTSPSPAERASGGWPEPPARWSSWRTSDGAPAAATLKQAKKAHDSKTEKAAAIRVHGPRAMASAIRSAVDKIRLLAEPLGPEIESELAVLTGQLRRGEGSARAALRELAPLADTFDEHAGGWEPTLTIAFWTFYFELEETLQELVDGQIVPLNRLVKEFERTRNPATMNLLNELSTLR